MIIENYILHLDQKEMLTCNIYSVTDALNVYMYVMYLIFEAFHMQELYPTTLYRLHSSELSRGVRLCQGGRMPPPPTK